MSELLYKTIAGVSPQGKPNVYFSCHPDDLGIYFDDYSSMILKTQDCAVWYSPENAGGDNTDDLEFSLSRMQLLFIPVTAKLLTSPNRAMDTEVPLALKLHIPVLPVMMEPGLDEVYARRFGDLQYLDPNDTDKTRRSFSEIFSSYIRATLVSDELAERVRGAFDTYIFLSYRKKDRKKAQELMRLIHSNPLCRDIAIWYDEFLIPGEDFNKAIEAMLKKSDLFALAVTPNIVNEVNYVMTTEYPAALEQGKPVLAVEMAETDRKELDEHYRALPPCVPGKDGEEFRAALLEKLKKLAVNVSDDPGHNFLIGLAYLDGIDVEVDPKRAFELISSSADAGLPEAMSQLITMYETGKGIERDPEKGAKWREIYVEKLRKTYRSEPTADNAETLINGLWNFGDALYAIGRIDDAASSYNEIQELSGRSSEVRFMRSASAAKDMLAKLATEKGDLSKAQKYYEQAAQAGEKLARMTRDTRDMHNLSVSYDGLGDIAKARGGFRSAQAYYEKGLGIKESILHNYRTVNSLRSLFVSIIRLGDNAGEAEDLSGAKTYYQRALNICLELAETVETAECRHDLSSVYSRLGDIFVKEGDLSNAREYYSRSLEINSSLAEENASIQSLYDMSVIYNCLGKLAIQEGDLPRARSIYEDSYSIVKDLAEKPGTFGLRSHFANTCDELCDIAKSMKDLSSAQHYCDLALEIRKGLAKETGTADSRRDLAISYNSSGDIAKERNDLSTARGHYFESLDICVRLSAETGSIRSRSDLSVIYSRLGEVSELEGDLSKAVFYYGKALEISEALSKATGSLQSRIDLSLDYNKLGSIEFSIGDYQRAIEYCEKGLAIREAVFKETGTVRSKRDLSVSCNKLAEICISAGEIQKAKEYYERCLDIRKSLAAETKAPQYIWDLAVIYYNLGLFYYNQAKDRGMAEEMFRSLVDISNIYDDASLRDLQENTKDILSKHF